MAGQSQMKHLTLTLLLYPFGLGAMAVNLFFASLINSWTGMPVLTPWQPSWPKGDASNKKPSKTAA